MNLFEKLKVALAGATECERRQLRPTKVGYEYTFPDCPVCGNWLNNDCKYKELCFVMLDSEGFRVGTPSEYEGRRLLHE